jgi:hypothetical protein
MNNAMNEPDERVDFGSKPGWRLRDHPRGWYGIALFTVLGSLLIAIVIGLRVSMGPPILAPAESLRPRPFAPWMTSKPAEELRRIATAEVKRWEGWSGKAGRPKPKEGAVSSVLVKRDPENPSGQWTQVDLHSVTGAIVNYRKEGPNAAEAADVWSELLRAMAARNEKRVRQLTTRAGFDSLEKDAEGEDRMKAFERRGKVLQKWETRWQPSDARDRVECLLGPEEKEQGLVFKKTAEGWKLDQWTPGE